MTEQCGGEVTRRLRAAARGDSEALEEVSPVIYDELRRLARAQMRSEGRHHTLQTTGLANEAFLKLAGQRGFEIESRGHFFAIASLLMRRILVNWAVAKRTQKRGGDAEIVGLDERLEVGSEAEPETILAVHQALDRLSETSRQAARVVECRYFAGLTIQETAEALGISTATVKRDWRLAKAWLRRELD